MKSLALKVILIATSILTSVVFAEAAPEPTCIEGPLTIVVPRSPGGGFDLLARLVGAEWRKKLGVEVIVENVEGAGGAIGLAQAYRAPADGTTVVSWSPPGEYILQLQGRLPFTVDEWEMIGATSSDPGMIVVPANSPFKSVNEILEASRSGGKRLAAGTVGRTTISALEAMRYEELFDVEWGLVPFDGGGDLTTALVGSHVDLGVRQGGLYNLHPETVRVLSVANASRIQELPDVPTVEEATGEKLVSAAYIGLAVRRGTSPKVLACLRKTFSETARSPQIADNQFDKVGFRYEFVSAEEFAKVNQAQTKIADQFKSRILGE